MSLAIPTGARLPIARPAREAVSAEPGAAGERRFALGVFFVYLIANLVFAYFLMYVWHIGQLDGVSRTANAFYVLFSRDPHLAAIGFVWPALPSLLQLSLLPGLFSAGHPEFSGPILSSFAGAGAIAVLSLIFGKFGLTGWTRAIWLALIAFHPQMFYQSSSGVAEMPFLIFILLACLAYFSLDRNEMKLAMLGLWLAFAFLVRYEALAFMGAFAALLLFRQLRNPARPVREGRMTAMPLTRSGLLVRWLPGRENWNIVEGRLLVALVPAMYAIGIWLILNWMILGDPLYFMRSIYSLASAPDVAKNVGSAHPLYSAMGSLDTTLHYAFSRITSVQVGLLLLVPAGIALLLWKRDRRLFAVLFLMAAIFSFTSYQVYSGTLPSYLRYWMYATPFAGILLVAIRSALAPTSRYGKAAFALFGTAVLAGGLVYSLNGLNDNLSGQDERRLAGLIRGESTDDLNTLISDSFWVRSTDAPALAQALDRASSDGLTMIDTETGFFGIMKAKYPQRLAIVSDRDFISLLDHPGGRVRYIFATQSVLGAGRDLISLKYPGLYDEQVTWARYRGQVEGTLFTWKIFEVDYSDPSLPAALKRPDDGTVSPRLAELRAATPTLPEMMVAWQTQRFLNGKDPHDWEAFVDHIKTVARISLSGGPPSEFTYEADEISS